MPRHTKTMRTSNSRRARGPAIAIAAMLVLTACGGGASSDDDTKLPSLAGRSVEVAAVWSGAEQEAFAKVIAGFEKKTGAKVSYVSTGDDIAKELRTKLKGKAAPDIAILPRPSLLHSLAADGDLKPLSADTITAIDDNYAGIWRQLGTVKNTVYGVWVAASNTSMIWYNAPAFDHAEAETPRTWDDLLSAAKALSEAGMPAPVALAGADGSALTNWFENIYLRAAGPENYDKLSRHEIPWSDPSVVNSLTLLRLLFADRTLVGDANTALQTDFAGSVNKVFTAEPGSGIVGGGRSVATVLGGSAGFTVGDDAKWFAFPSVENSPPAVMGGGDVAVQLTDDKATQAFMNYLASPAAAAKLVSTGALVSPNKNVGADAYPDDNVAGVGKSIVDAGDDFRFDMSELLPAKFARTPGAGEQKILQEFLLNPSNPAATAKALEAAAARSYD